MERLRRRIVRIKDVRNKKGIPWEEIKVLIQDNTRWREKCKVEE